MKIVIFSDTHGLHDKVNIPGGDMLIFAGDMCGTVNYLMSLNLINS